MKITIILLTYNEENNITDCLESLKDVNANIFVVDSYSTDRTLSILAQRNITYVQHAFENYSKQRNWAQANNPFHTDWVFHLDAGERITPELCNWLKTEFNPDSTEYDGYMFSRKTMFFGKWIRRGGHYPNYHLRLYRAWKGKCEDKIYDQHFVSEGKTKALAPGKDIIDTVADNLRDFTNAHSKWALYEAIEILSHSHQAGEVKSNLLGSPIEKRRWLKKNIFEKSPLFLRSILYFFYRYFLQLGFLDGKIGLIFHFLQGFWFRFLIDAMVVELKTKMAYENLTLKELLQKYYDPALLKLLKY